MNELDRALRDAEIINLFRSGVPQVELAGRFDLERGRVRAILKSNGLVQDNPSMGRPHGQTTVWETDDTHRLKMANWRKARDGARAALRGRG